MLAGEDVPGDATGELQQFGVKGFGEMACSSGVPFDDCDARAQATTLVEARCRRQVHAQSDRSSPHDSRTRRPTQCRVRGRPRRSGLPSHRSDRFAASVDMDLAGRDVGDFELRLDRNRRIVGL